MRGTKATLIEKGGRGGMGKPLKGVESRVVGASMRAFLLLLNNLCVYIV